jgi:nitrogen fixation NifU-like protein
MSDLEELYREVILEHHRSPHGRAPLAKVDASAEGHNPSCGDEVSLGLALDGERIVGVHVSGRGCAISTASGSILAQELRGRHVEEAQGLYEAFRRLLRGEALPADLDVGDLAALAGVRSFPARVKCALLPWAALDEALAGRGGCTHGDRGALVSTERADEEVGHG